jgi:hypothetical protein
VFCPINFDDLFPSHIYMTLAIRVGFATPVGLLVGFLGIWETLCITSLQAMIINVMEC